MKNVIEKIYEDVFGALRTATIVVYTGLLAIIQPLMPVILLLFGASFTDFICGFGASRKNKESFSGSKAFMSIFKLIAYFVLIILVYQAMMIFNEIEWANFLVKWISWFTLVIYIINILKNLNVLFPQSKGFKIMYKILTVDVKNYAEKFINKKLDL